jgi:Rod binding domain-containing protein
MDESSGIPRSALDFQGYGELKARASARDSKATREVAQQFEAMFIQMMLKSMRSAVPKNEMTQSKTMETFEGMYDREIAVALSRKGGLGLADMMEKHLNSMERSSKNILEERFALQKAFELEKKQKSLDLVKDVSGKTYPLKTKVENLPVYELRNKSFPIGNLGSTKLITTPETEYKKDENK